MGARGEPGILAAVGLCRCSLLPASRGTGCGERAVGLLAELASVLVRRLGQRRSDLRFTLRRRKAIMAGQSSIHETEKSIPRSRKRTNIAANNHMLKSIRKLNQTANRNVAQLFLIGFTSVLAYNWRQWRCDKALAQRLRDEQLPAPKLARAPKVSALVAAWNEAGNIDAHIKSFLALAYPNIELILCAGGSDDTLARARRYSGERIVVLEQRAGEGKQRALARCYEQANGEIIYLTDADCLFDDEALVRLLAAIVNDGERVATGRFAPLPNQQRNPFVNNQWAVDTYARSHAGAYVTGLIGRNAVSTRAALKQSHALEVDVAIGTDYYLAKRLIAEGYRIRYVHGSVVSTHYHTMLMPYVQQQSRWLRNIMLHGRQFGAHNEVAGAIRNCSVGIVTVALPLFTPILGAIAWALWFMGLCFAGINRARYLLFSRSCSQPTPLQALLLAPLYAVLDLIMLAYAGTDAVLRKRVRW